MPMVFEFDFGVAEDLFDFFDVGGTSDYVEYVAELEDEFGCGEQVESTAADSADVDVVLVAQAQRAEFFAVDRGSADDDAARDELVVDGVPVDVFLVPVTGFLFAEEDFQFCGVFRGGDDEQVVVFEKDCG